MPVKTYLGSTSSTQVRICRGAKLPTKVHGQSTHSTVLLHAGGLLIVMNTQLDRIVIMMNMLNNLMPHKEANMGRVFLSMLLNMHSPNSSVGSSRSKDMNV